MLLRWQVCISAYLEISQLFPVDTFRRFPTLILYNFIYLILNDTIYLECWGKEPEPRGVRKGRCGVEASGAHETTPGVLCVLRHTGENELQWERKER